MNLRRKMVSVAGAVAILIAALLNVPLTAYASAESSAFQVRLKGDFPESMTAGEEYVFDVYAVEAVSADTIAFNFMYDSDILEIDEDKTGSRNNGWACESGRSDFISGGYKASLQGRGTIDAGQLIYQITTRVLKDTHKTSVKLAGVSASYEGAAVPMGSESDALAVGTDEKVFKLSMRDASAYSGGSVSIPLNIAENSGINALGVTITYNKDMCTYNDLTITDAFKDKIAVKSIYAVPDEGEIRAAFIAKDNITDTGIFANLSFQMKADAAVGAASDVTVKITQVENKEETKVSGSGASAKLTVISQSQPLPVDPFTLGDVNGDGRIDLKDAVYILLAYNGEKTLTAQQQSAADVNKDNAVDLEDALQILKYFNREITAF